MDTPVLQISAKKYSGESAVVSVRLPKEMLREIDEIASTTGRNRNELMTLFLEFALTHTEILAGDAKDIKNEVTR